MENFVKMGVELEKMGCDSIGIKDMSGIIQPQIAYHMVKELKSEGRHPDHAAHARHRRAWARPAYLAAIEAGVDCVEVSIVPFANGTSQPDTQRMLALLEGHPRCPKFDTAKLAKLRDYFEGVYKELASVHQPGQRARGQRHSDLPGARRHALQLPHPAEGTGDGRQVRRGAARKSRSCGRRWAGFRW